MNRLPHTTNRRRALTMIELIVVLVILSILSGIAAGVYTKEVVRARYARCRAEIQTMEIAIARYFVDNGQYPPSGSGNQLPPSSLSPDDFGSGYLQVALRSSLSGDVKRPLSVRWQGPYIEWDYRAFGTRTGAPLPVPSSLPKGQVQLLDPFGFPYTYIRSSDYATLDGTRLPAGHPLATDVYYNPSTFQIISFGADNRTILNEPGSRGLGPDDVTNFQGSGL